MEENWEVNIDAAVVQRFVNEASAAAQGAGYPSEPMTAAMTLLAAAEAILTGFLGDKLPRKLRKQMRDDARNVGIELHRQAMHVADLNRAEMRH